MCAWADQKIDEKAQGVLPYNATAKQVQKIAFKSRKGRKKAGGMANPRRARIANFSPFLCEQADGG